MVLSWLKGGLALGAVFFIAVALIEPIGVSTQFVVFDGILWDAVNDSAVVAAPEAKSGFKSPNAYLDKYANSVAKPLNYGFVFVLAVMAGAGLSALLRGGVPAAERTMPQVWRANYGDSPWKRYAASFLAGLLVLYGARLAGGCTSGHMMSGIMQTSVSGYLFVLGAFAVGIPLAILLFRKEA
jgi:uncharacterized membrane protein YedE/YeeE